MRTKRLIDFTDRFGTSLLPFDVPARSFPIAGAASDSKKARKDFIFFALRGRHVHGVSFAKEALENGASILLAEVPVSASLLRETRIVASQNRAAVFLAKDLTRHVGRISNWIYDDPSKDLTVVAITGTNGKTTITYMLEAVARQKGGVGVLGTVSYRIRAHEFPASLTTPQPDEVIRYLDLMRQKRCCLCFVEATSQALDMGRLDDIKIDGAIFINLTRDHLDYHKTFKNYFHAKSKLFTELLARSPKPGLFAVINVDDPWAHPKLWKTIMRLRDVQKISFGIFNEKARIRAKDIRQNRSGVSFVLSMSHQEIPINLKLLGFHNVSNALAAASAAYALRFSLKEIKKGLESLKSVPGRLEKISQAKDFLVLVDYAHSPDALANAIRAVRGIDGVKRIITVFGCGGDRDKGKRPLMGQIAARLGDFAVVTSDNPRSEDPNDILRAIEEGIKAVNKTNFMSLVDRAEAIRWALSQAKQGDCVLIAGKGHETYQIFKDKTIHFDDREICRKILKAQKD